MWLPLGDDHHVVPVVELEELFKAGLVDKRAGDFLLAVGRPDRLLADQAHAAALAPFVVDEAGDGGQLVSFRSSCW